MIPSYFYCTLLNREATRADCHRCELGHVCAGIPSRLMFQAPAKAAGPRTVGLSERERPSSGVTTGSGLADVKGENNAKPAALDKAEAGHQAPVEAGPGAAGANGGADASAQPVVMGRENIRSGGFLPLTLSSGFTPSTFGLPIDRPRRRINHTQDRTPADTAPPKNYGEARAGKGCLLTSRMGGTKSLVQPSVPLLLGPSAARAPQARRGER